MERRNGIAVGSIGMTPDFERAIGGLADIPQWFLWLLEWNAEEGKYDKMPAQRNGAALTRDTGGADSPANWMTYDDACAALRALPATAERKYTLGFWLTRECGYWFLDIDMRSCGLAQYTSTQFADGLVAAYPGAFLEWSSSLKGLHIIGRGDVSELHRTRPERDVARKLAPLELEFYSDGRGIAFGTDGAAWGSADLQFDMQPLLMQFFPDRPQREPGDGARPEWRGPADDDVLLERALSARVSAEVAFGGKASFAQLFRGDCEHNSEADMALAAHLAFWTGCDADRIERIMRRSGLVRPKWNDRRRHTTYLGMTIENACAGTDNVYQEPERNLTVQQDMYAVPAAAPACKAPPPGPPRACRLSLIAYSFCIS